VSLTSGRQQKHVHVQGLILLNSQEAAFEGCAPATLTSCQRYGHHRPVTDQCTSMA